MAYTLGKAVVTAPARVASARSVDSMSEEAKFYAHLSNVAYIAPPQRPLHQGDYSLDLEFNTEHFAVYVQGGISSAKAVIVAFRGTSDMSDVRNDILLAPNTNFNRLNELLASEVDCIGEVARKYPEAQLDVTGHSLGGTIAMFVTVHTGLVSSGHIFNPGAGVKTEELLLGAVSLLLGAPFRIALGISAAAGALACAHERSHESYGVGKVEELASRIDTHHVLGDPLSMLFSLGNIQCYSPVKTNLHALANFIDDVPPSTDGARSSQAMRGFVLDSGKGCGAPTTRCRGRSVEPKTRSRREHGLRGNCAHRTHSHSGTGGWTEVFVGAGALSKVSAGALSKVRAMTKPFLMERVVTSAEAVAPSSDAIEDWRSGLDVGSTVEVLARGGERQWVEAEVVVARSSVLTLKWFAADGRDEKYRRLTRDSSDIRDPRSCPDHVDARTNIDAESIAPMPNATVKRENSVVPSETTVWRINLTVGCEAEILVKKHWTRAVVAIARENVVTMKWVDSEDDAEVLRRVSRHSTELRPCKV